MYGLFNKQELINIINNVVDNLGGGSNAKLLLYETAGIESLWGTITYNPLRDYGLGVMQFDRVGFEDTKNRTSSSKKEKILKIYGVDIDMVNYRDLIFSPLLSVIFARLKYLLVPSPIPDTREQRATYWYKWYNGGGIGSLEFAKNKYLEINRDVIA